MHEIFVMSETGYENKKELGYNGDENNTKEKQPE